ncbi:hypothetical protein K461DRAFT_250919 [Myriangium duriaei CBS 260.36]|uniref:C2 domain-containing protein n=1 Tax=Myriangium duriaei CBS 260.36 TaxID=1168546 RepID=A0A9P4J9W7_9PEZI|nr:hypothetical protein K461DRAFT_250919 [Myriangium duriaei CBS 260.36]
MADTEKLPTTEHQSSSGSEQEKEKDKENAPNGQQQDSDQHKEKGLPKKPSEIKGALSKKKEDHKEPAGGYDSTPIPNAPPGWTVKFTFIRATNLPMADINTLSSDPYVSAQLNTGLQTRHKEDPHLRFRTHTIRRETDPVWNSEWIVANVPSSGFRLKARLYDEDPADHDDRLGNAHINVHHIDENWGGIKEQAFSIKKRSGSKRAYLARAVATCVRIAKHMRGELYVSVEVLGRTKDENGGRMYTVGPTWWVKHYSPMLGRITGQKEDKNGNNPREGGHKRNSTQRYNFQANQMQLPGPVPAELYHRYVEFKPFVQGMFTHKGVRGYLLNKALHHQHARVYNYDRSTLWGYIPTNDPEALTRRFLELVHYDKGGKIFTYVLTLDAQMRFTETGKEFGIDMLSKHTMHSDVEIYIAFSGEFFIRRHRSRKQDNSTALEESSESGHGHGPDPSKPVSDLDPSNYELIIDNDSGTYRPNAELLPLFRLFIQRSFPGLHVRVLDCQKDEEKMGKLKQEQRDRKKAESGGEEVVFAQRARGDSLSSQSSSDDEEFDALAAGGGDRSFKKQIKRDAQWRAGARVRHLKGLDPRTKRAEGQGGQVQDGIQDEEQAVGGGEGEAKEEDVKGKEQGLQEQTAAEQTMKERGHDYDPEKELEGKGQGQSIGRAVDVEAEHARE